jgi:hypothetical protein
MDGPPKIPNLVLRAIREKDRQETRAEFAEAIARKARELGEAVAPTERYVARLEDGDVRNPHPPYRRVLTALLGRSMSELGFTQPHLASAGSRVIALPARSGFAMPDLAGSAYGAHLAGGGFAETCEWPVWFGVRLARLMNIADSWAGPITRIDSIQSLLDEEILMFDAVAPEHQGPDHTAHSLARRQALISLASLPLTITAANLAASRSRGAARNFFLSRCAASITACWHLLRGSDLSAVDQMLSGYLLTLEGIAQQQSKYQQLAAGLASQAHRISGIIALHRNQLRVREQHCKRALHYATLAADPSSQASALISLASTYFYTSDPEQAAAVYERACALRAGMPPLQQSRVHAELSVVYGQLSREQDAARSAELAGTLYPEHPEQDPSYLYAEFTPASLTLEQGLAYVALAERYPAKGYQHRAADILGSLDDTAPAAVPDRIRFEIINNQAKTAVLLGDIDAFEAHLHRGLDGVAALGSRQRLRELQRAWHDAKTRWPGEQRVTQLSERLQLTSSETPKE